MDSLAQNRSQLVEAVNALPQNLLPELADFLSYLEFKSAKAVAQHPSKSGSDFLLSIAALGEAVPDLAERAEEILADKIDPIRGFSLTDADSE